MSILPRLAVGSIQAEADPQPMVWAVLNALEQEGVRTQSFLSRLVLSRAMGRRRFREIELGIWIVG